MDLVGRSHCKWSSCFDVLQVPNCNWALIQKSHIIWCKFMRCMSCQRIIMYFMYCHVNVLSCTVMYLIAVHCIFRTENTKIYKTCKLGNTHTHTSYTPIFTASILGFGAVMVGIVVRIDGLCLQACNGVKLLKVAGFGCVSNCLTSRAGIQHDASTCHYVTTCLILTL